MRVDRRSCETIPPYPYVATTLENYADLLRTNDREDEADKLETRAAAIRQIKLSSANVRVGSNPEVRGSLKLSPLCGVERTFSL